MEWKTLLSIFLTPFLFARCSSQKSPSSEGDADTSKKPIEIFVRHCHYSAVSAHKNRPQGFSKERCFHNLLDSLKDEEGVNLTILLDTFHPMEGTHFVYSQNRYPIIEFRGGSETASFLFMLDYVLSGSFSPDTIIYFLEDDYWHLPRWPSILREGFSIPEVTIS